MQQWRIPFWEVVWLHVSALDSPLSLKFLLVFFINSYYKGIYDEHKQNKNKTIHIPFLFDYLRMLLERTITVATLVNTVYTIFKGTATL